MVKDKFSCLIKEDKDHGVVYFFLSGAVEDVETKVSEIFNLFPHEDYGTVVQPAREDRECVVIRRIEPVK